jgi:hypothetical protein
MLSSLLAVSWEPEIRGILVVLVMVGVLIGGTYLIVGTNLGARLGFMVVMAALAGWMMSMGGIWWVYGIGLQGELPSWQPNDPIAIVRDANFMDDAEVLEAPVKVDGMSSVESSSAVSEQLQAEGWLKLDEADPRRAQAISSADEILQVEAGEFEAGEYIAVDVFDKGGERYPKINDALDFIAFWHAPHYSIVEVAPVIPQRAEPGRAPARPVIDESQPREYVVMIRDLGNKRQPAMFITLGSAVIFGMFCVLLHRRDRIVSENRQLTAAKS